MNKIKFKMNSVFKQKAFTIQELAVALAVLTIISSMATFKIIGFRRQLLVLKEQSVVRALTKAAILYNTANDKWYGTKASENPFTGLLENPPPFVIGPVFNSAEDGIHWELEFNPGDPDPVNGYPATWNIACPHLLGMGTKGTWWIFTPEGGSIYTAFGPQHDW